MSGEVVVLWDDKAELELFLYGQTEAQHRRALSLQPLLEGDASPWARQLQTVGDVSGVDGRRHKLKVRPASPVMDKWAPQMSPFKGLTKSPLNDTDLYRWASSGTPWGAMWVTR